MQTIIFAGLIESLFCTNAAATPDICNQLSQVRRRRRNQSMEAFGVVVSRPIPSVSGGTGVEPQRRNASLSGFSCKAAVGTQRNLRASGKSLKVCGFSNFVFSDQSYMDYYSSGRKFRCGACKEVKGEKEMKKRLKRLKGLSRELALFSQKGSHSDNVSVDPLKDKMISEAAELLEGQIQQLRSEEKKLKQRRKEEKSRLKAAKMQKMLEHQVSSSSSSESSDSDSDCGQVVDMNLLTCNPREKQIPDATQPVPDNETLALPGTSMPQEGTPDDLPKGNLAVGTGIKTCCSSGSLEQGWSSEISNSSGDGVGFTGSKTLVAKKIEVCMGGKCKKSGAALLIEKFRRVLGIEAAVSGCKCMGKCRNGPNVRISDNFKEDMEAVLAHDSVKPAADHLCIGVGLEDVDLIVENLLGRSQEKIDLAATSH